MVRPQLDEWRAESVRFSYFFAGETAEDLRRGGLWRSITELEPESSTTRQAEGVIQEQGAYLGGQLTVAVGANRVDIILSATPVANDFPNFGNVKTVVDEFRRAVAAGAEQVEAGANRLAYGLTATRRCRTREESYATLDELLSNVKVDSATRDFFYQVNRPRPSRTDSAITLNRLSRWVPLVMKQLRLDGDLTAISDVHAVRIELDFNTASETPTPSRLDINVALVAELISDAETLLVEGEH
jgi:hypothetical protein